MQFAFIYEWKTNHSFLPLKTSTHVLYPMCFDFNIKISYYLTLRKVITKTAFKITNIIWPAWKIDKG